MKRISLDETSACQAHASLHDDSTSLAAIIADTRAALATGPVTWQVTITPRNVHCVESLLLMAQITGCTLAPEPSPELSARERAFLEDVLTHYAQSASAQQEPSGPGLSGYVDFARDCLKVLLGMLPAALRRRRNVSGLQLRHATLIGVYGGEHVGDIAILGGVLLRLHRQFGVREATLFSHRPEYTRRLAAHLDTPVTLEVQPGQPVLVKQELKTTGALVWAGGPIMDLPPVLVRQLGAIYRVRRRGRPVLLEGVGVGPFRRAPSRWVARRIAMAADRIALRTSGAAQDPILEQIDVHIGQDPAFDYLETRGKLTRLVERDHQTVDALLQGTTGHILVGINLRPIRHFWGIHGEAYSRTMEERFFQHLAVAMTDYARLAPAPVTYIFFPMNLIQDGYSDLAAAWRLHRMLHKGLDLRIWEADPDIDAVLYLLRKLDMALTMRFHACIFAMSQGLPTIGIDYYPGVGGKVEQLFRDRELVEDVRRLDEADMYFLVERLLKNQPGGNNHPDRYP
ncbi:MAG: polysaccharide pyruvyl transferase family protein [Gammaproteobacteria bacterium]|jgi:polysaccharide pyruvyl transferase WcaK-like protein